MKLLLFSDLHCDSPPRSGLVELAAARTSPSAPATSGKCVARVGVCIDVLKRPALPDRRRARQQRVARRTARCLSRLGQAFTFCTATASTINGVHFFGLGGGVPVTPFGSWSCDFSEDEAAELLKDFPPGGVLVSHSPPKGCLDVDGERHESRQHNRCAISSWRSSRRWSCAGTFMRAGAERKSDGHDGRERRAGE